LKIWVWEVPNDCFVHVNNTPYPLCERGIQKVGKEYA
jgi:hypothetical protein